jgi:hypothetical protein
LLETVAFHLRRDNGKFFDFEAVCSNGNPENTLVEERATLNMPMNVLCRKMPLCTLQAHPSLLLRARECSVKTQNPKPKTQNLKFPNFQIPNPKFMSLHLRFEIRANSVIEHRTNDLVPFIVHCSLLETAGPCCFLFLALWLFATANKSACNHSNHSNHNGKGLTARSASLQSRHAWE